MSAQIIMPPIMLPSGVSDDRGKASCRSKVQSPTEEAASRVKTQEQTYMTYPPAGLQTHKSSEATINSRQLNSTFPALSSFPGGQYIKADLVNANCTDLAQRISSHIPTFKVPPFTDIPHIPKMGTPQILVAEPARQITSWFKQYLISDPPQPPSSGAQHPSCEALLDALIYAPPRSETTKRPVSTMASTLPTVPETGRLAAIQREVGGRVDSGRPAHPLPERGNSNRAASAPAESGDDPEWVLELDTGTLEGFDSESDDDCIIDENGVGIIWHVHGEDDGGHDTLDDGADHSEFLHVDLLTVETYIRAMSSRAAGAGYQVPWLKATGS